MADGPNWNATVGQPGGYDPKTMGDDIYTGGGYDPNGPLAALESDPFGIGQLKYPRDIGLDPRGHYINFYINVADNSSDLQAGAYGTLPDTQGTTQKNQAQYVSSADTGAQSAVAAQSVFQTRKTKRIGAVITLYMPETVNVQYGANWQSESLTDATGPLGQAASLVTSSLSSLLKNKGNKTQTGVSGAWAEIAGNYLAGKGYVGQGATNFALFATGYAINPQLEVLFTGTNMREFQFDFLFSPYNAAEARSVVDIIKRFKFHQAPEVVVDSVGRFFVPPSEFDIEFQNNGQTNENIHKIGTCVLTNINVDYAPNGWSAFADGTPTNIRMTLNFMETEIVTKQRVKEGY